MATRRPLRRRYRVLLWLDETGGPLQAAHAIYVDDDMLTERTFDCEPFDTVDEVLREVLAALDIQRRLF